MISKRKNERTNERCERSKTKRRSAIKNSKIDRTTCQQNLGGTLAFFRFLQSFVSFQLLYSYFVRYLACSSHSTLHFFLEQGKGGRKEESITSGLLRNREACLFPSSQDWVLSVSNFCGFLLSFAISGNGELGDWV